MKAYVVCLAIIFAALIGSIIIPVNAKATITGFIFTALLIQGTTKTLLHFTFCRSGMVAPFALPLMWVSCLLPLYIYCFEVMSVTGFGSRVLVFATLGFFALAPAIIISFITALIFFLMQNLRK